MPCANAALHEAVGAYLAADVVADRDVPFGDRAVMDGYAVRAADLSSAPVELRIVGEVAAGSDAVVPVSVGECARIFTGASVPPGADSVVPVEDTSTGSFADAQDENVVTILRSASKGSHVLPGGVCARQGQVLLPVGTRLGATQLAICAACGCAQIRIRQRPRVLILITGAEIVTPESDVTSRQVRDSNGPLLEAALAEARLPSLGVRRVPDDLELTVEALRDALAVSDVVILTGGVSAGRRDYVPAAVRKAGCVVHYHGVAMKPGKPQLFATFSSRQCVFGLPGNPLSATIGLCTLVMPALRLVAGCSPDRCSPRLYLPLSEELNVSGERQLFITGRLVETPQGSRVRSVMAAGSADLVTAGLTEGCFAVPAGTHRLPAGTLVPFQPWSWQQ